tara:strand:+ start:444 stop:617 length:174 start_codon:yes stop_codon:yes gene_type:complete
MHSSYYIGIFLLLGLFLSGVVAILVGISTSIGFGLGILAALDVFLISAAYYLLRTKK